MPPVYCQHDSTPDVCEVCAEIRRLLRENPDRRDPRWVSLNRFDDERSNEQLLESFKIGRTLRPRQQRPKTPLLPVFQCVNDVETAQYYRAVSAEERDVLMALCDKPKNWVGLAKRVGRHHRTVQRIIRRIRDRLGTIPITVDSRPATVQLTRERGSQRKALWLQHEVRIGNWRRRFATRVPRGKKRTRMLVSKLPREERVLTLIPSTKMRTLLDALVWHFSRGSTPVRDPETFALSDWAQSVKWVERRFSRRKTRPTTYKEVLLALTARLRICERCHTPILAGCYLHGRRINRTRRYCDDRCKMAKFRVHS